MKRAIVVAFVCVSIPCDRALALDWSVNSSLSETVELNSNQFLRSMLAGGTLGSYSTITANAQARTPTSKFIFDGDISYQKYWGPGTEGIPQTEFRQDGVHARYEMTGKDPTDLTYGEVSLREGSTALAILNQLGIATNAQGFVDTSMVKGGIERNISSIDFATLSARTTYTSYDPPGGGIPFTDSSVLGTWRHRLNTNWALTASSELEWLNYNNATNTHILISRNQAGIDATLSPVLSLHATGGLAYIKADQSAFLSVASIASSTSASGADFIGDMGLTYRALKDTTLTLFANQTVGPTVVGSLTKSTSIGASLVQTINARSSLLFAASASRSTTTTSNDFYSASVTYSYQLAREWNSQISYRHLHRTAVSGSTTSTLFDPITGIPIISATGAADSDSLMLVITRNFTVLPPGK